ncbi:MAG TPA: hypothetical protein PK317_01580 [Coprothermobacter proteolyticus]|nr:hypothetical protein [Coprothermobacter proteolyticus]
MAVDSYQFPGDLSLSEIVIKSTNGTEVNITPQVVELNIFENMFSNSLTAKLVIVDSVGIVGQLPITGFESVTFTLNNPNSRSKTLDFFVYKIDPRVAINSHSTGYVLNLVSYEAILDQTTSFSSAFSGKISAIVKTVFKRFFGGRNKVIELHETDNSTRAICPFWTPFQFINWLANRSFPKGGNAPTFFFFETLSGFYFKSLDSMFSSAPIAEYIFRPKNIQFKNNALLEKMVTVLDYKVLESATSLELVSNGAFGAQLYVKDINENSFTKKVYSYSNSNFPRLNEHPIKPSIDAFGSNLESPNNTKVIGTCGQPFSDTSDVNNFDRWVMERKAVIELLNAKRVEIYVHGHLAAEVGKTVELILPTGEKTIDNFVSGKYLIVGLNHSINNQSKHMMSLELVSESYISEAHKANLLDRTVKVSK